MPQVHLGVHGNSALCCVFMMTNDNKKARLNAGFSDFCFLVRAIKCLLDILNLLTHLLNQHFQLDAATGDFSIDGF